MGSNIVNTELPAPRTPADGMALLSCPDSGGPSYLYNAMAGGGTLDLERNDVEHTVRASALQNIGNDQSADVTSYNHESLLLIVNVTAVGSSAALLTPSLQGKQQLSNAYFTFWTAELPIKAIGTYSYFFANGASGGDFTECQAFGLAPRIFRTQQTVAGASVTYSISCVLGDS